MAQIDGQSVAQTSYGEQAAQRCISVQTLDGGGRQRQQYCRQLSQLALDSLSLGGTFGRWVTTLERFFCLKNDVPVDEQKKCDVR